MDECDLGEHEAAEAVDAHIPREGAPLHALTAVIPQRLRVRSPASHDLCIDC